MMPAHQPDAHFTAHEQRRMFQLMARWREMQSDGTHFTAEERMELSALVERELRASGARASALADELGL